MFATQFLFSVFAPFIRRSSRQTTAKSYEEKIRFVFIDVSDVSEPLLTPKATVNCRSRRKTSVEVRNFGPEGGKCLRKMENFLRHTDTHTDRASGNAFSFMNSFPTRFHFFMGFPNPEMSDLSLGNCERRKMRRRPSGIPRKPLLGK